jgi:hypothetical protein
MCSQPSAMKRDCLRFGAHVHGPVHVRADLTRTVLAAAIGNAIGIAVGAAARG